MLDDNLSIWPSKPMILNDNLSCVTQDLDILLRGLHFKPDCLSLTSFLSHSCCRMEKIIWLVGCYLIKIILYVWIYKLWSVPTEKTVGDPISKIFIKCSPPVFIFASEAGGRKWDLFRALIWNCPMKLWDLNYTLSLKMSLLYRKGHHLKLSELEYIKLHIQ